MRFYDYRCQKCSEVKEYYEPTNADSKPHPCECGGEMKRIITSPTNFNVKTYPANWNMKHSERRERWNSPDNSVKI